MGAQPKRKITRAMQGKRRRGNTPKLMKDVSVSKMPMHRKTLFGQLLAAIGAK